MNAHAVREDPSGEMERPAAAVTIAVDGTGSGRGDLRSERADPYVGNGIASRAQVLDDVAHLAGGEQTGHRRHHRSGESGNDDRARHDQGFEQVIAALRARPPERPAPPPPPSLHRWGTGAPP